LTYACANAQSFYWIGGDGSFDDPAHWSYTSGGISAGKIPGPSNSVIFDAGSGTGDVKVTFLKSAACKDFLAVNPAKRFIFSGGASHTLVVTGSFSLAPLVRFGLQGPVKFRSAGPAICIVDFGLNILNNDIYFGAGHFDIHSLHLSDQNTIRLGGGIYSFSDVTIVAGNLVNDDQNAVMKIRNSLFKITNKLKIATDEGFDAEDLKLQADIYSKENYDVTQAVKKSKFINNNNVVANCPSIVISSSPSCSGPCTGTLSVFIPAICNAGPYDILVSNAACSSQASSMSISGLSSPTTYIVPNACACSLSNYQVIVFDNLGNVAATKNENFLANPITVTGSTFAPSCNASCNGTINGNIFGSGPFTLSVLPNTVTPAVLTTTMPYSITNLCAGVYTLNVVDNFGCSSFVTRTITAPAAISPNAVTQSITCNSFTTGSFSVSPTGGVGSFTVNFSTGPTLTVAAGGTVGINNLPPGAVSATITDANSCTVTASTVITQPSTITVASTVTNITCGGSCTGAASLTVNGGGGSYSYTWSGSASSAANASSLCAGSHTVTIRDNYNCTRTHTLNVTQPTSISITPTITHVVCTGSCTGGITVTASGPAPPITFTWFAPPSGTVIGNTSGISSRCAGAYTLESSAASDPTCIVQTIINLTQTPAFTLTPVTQSITCRNACTGSATIGIDGGNGSPFTYTWTPANVTTPGAASLCAGVQTVTIRDASNCPVTTTINIVQPAAFAFGITTTSISCNGGCNGIINASPSGGTAPYTYTLASPAVTLTSATPIFSNLCAGTYTLFVRDAASSCAQQATVVLSQPNALVGSVSTTSITCFNACNGALAGSAAGGNAPYTMVWTTSGGTVSGGALSSLCAGNYTFNVRDANNCAAPAVTVNLAQPPDITVTIAPTNPSCFSSCNGVLNAAVAPAGSYTLNWVNNGFTGNPNTGLCAGTYTLNVVNTNGCTKTATRTLVAPTALTVTPVVAQTRCAGSCDGSATVTAAGGAGSYTYQFNTTPTIGNVTGTVNGLCAGGYIVSVNDASGCSQSANFTITSPLVLSAAITGTRNSCSSCTGGATVTPSNGTPPYTTFAWTNSLNLSAGSASVVSNLCPGNYTVVVTDSRSCTATTSVNIGQIVIAAAVSGGTGIQCFGACTASVVASVSGGQSPYTFTWTPGAQTTGTAVNLCAGNYTVNISDSSSPSCSSSATISVSQPPDLLITTSQTNITCFNSCNGALGASATGGTGPVSYSWSPGGQTTSTISALCGGTYTLRVTDANGCTKPPLTFTVSAPFPAITAAVNAVNPTQCTAPNNGSICVTAGGGNGTFSYTWSPAVAGNTNCATSLIAGTYSIIVASAACSNTFLTTLSNPAGPALTQVTLQPVSCFGGTNGAISYSASGTGPISFTWTPAVSFTNLATSSSASGLSSGTYVIASSDGNQCVTTQTVFVPQSTSVTVNAAVSNIQCSGTACDGSISVNPSGGNGPYTYTWSTSSNSSSVTSLCAGSYTLNLRDNNLCPSTFTFVLVSPPQLTISAAAIDIRCNGACNGSITANAGGGTGAISYSWLPVGAFTGSSTATVLNLCVNSYTVLATDANGCSISTVMPVTEPPVLTSTLVSTNETCFNSCNGSASISVIGGTPGYSFAWSGGAATSPSVGNLCAGNYTGTVIDANGCMSATGFTVISPAPLVANLTPNHPLCNASCNGSITTVIGGAQGSVNFSWTPSGTGQNPNNLCAGTYTLRATDANSCVVQSVITLTNPPALLANVNVTNASCNGDCNGVAVSMPLNGNAPLIFSWIPVAPNSATVNNLCAGDYTISVSDANLCSVTQTFSISEPPLINVNSSTGPASCGASNGSITAIPVGGTPGYTFTWSSPVPPPIATTGSVVTNLAAGIYTVQVTDASGCSNTVTIPLSNSNGPTAAVTSTNVLCNGACTGAASVGVISSGTSPYAIPVWIIPTPTVQGAFISNLCAGDYTVELRDSLNCLGYTGATITEPPPIVIQPAMQLPLCNGVCNGSVTLHTIGGAGAYTYSWSPAGNTGSVVNNLCAGTYSVIVGYNNGACQSPPVVVNVPATSSIVIGPAAVTPNRCFGDCAASATVNVIPGNGLPVGAVLYSWSNSQIGNVANNLCSGIYSVNVTDSQGCSDTHSVNITGAAQLTVSAQVTEPACGRCDGSATITAGGGTGSTYSLNWTSGGTGSIVSNLCPGLYQVQITDSLNCSQTQNIIINNSNGITGEIINKQDETCAASCNGAATVTAVGGTPPVNYNWLGSAPVVTAATNNNLCEGQYFVQMTDAAGCVRTASFDITGVIRINLAAFVIPPGCAPATNGSVRVVASGGTPTYSYTWNPPLSTGSVITNIGIGTYTVTVIDLNGTGCPETRIVNVNNLNGPQIDAIVQNNDCASQCQGSVILSSTVAGVQYLWSNGSTSSSLTGLCRGVISVTATAGACSSVRTFTVTENDEMFAETFSEQVNCGNDCNGSIHIQAVGGQLPYTFNWSPVTSSFSQLDSICAGVYSFTVTDLNGCLVSGADSIIQRPEVTVTSTVVNSSCSSISDGSINISVNGGTPAYSYTWTGPGNFTSTQQDLTQILSGTYSLTLRDSLNCTADTALFVSATVSVSADAGPDLDLCPLTPFSLSAVNSQGAVLFAWHTLPAGTPVGTGTILNLPAATSSQTFLLFAFASNTLCTDTDFIQVNVFEEPYLDAGPSFTIPVFSTVTIGGNPTAVNDQTISWSPVFSLSDSLSYNPVASNTVDVTYTVSAIYGLGCITSDTMRVLIYPEIRITSGFSPNNDGKNDQWIIDHIDQFPENTVEIYNRWGEQLFYSRGYETPFDGKYKGGNLPVGTYYYIIHLNHPAYTKPYIGPLTIFR
jgi:gliding motility-associated-like protein